MAALYDFLEETKRNRCAAGNFLGLLNVLIGRRVARSDGSTVSAGLTWREAALALKKARWDREAVRELGIDPATLPPRDRQRFWYSAISQAQVDSPAASGAGDRLAEAVAAAGYQVSAAPRPQKESAV